MAPPRYAFYMQLYIYTTLLISQTQSVVTESSTSLSKSPPHIIFILADDLGWNDVGWHNIENNEEIVTPNMNYLITQGIELNAHYVYAVCSPSRTSFLSGRFPVHGKTTATF